MHASTLPMASNHPFFDKHAFIGAHQKSKAVRHAFDGRTLVCTPSGRVRAFYFGMSMVFLAVLGWLVYGVYRDGPYDGIDRGEGAILVASALFVPVLLLQVVWVFRYERSFVWDFTAQSIVVTRRDFGRRRRVEMSGTDVSSVQTKIIRRLRSRKYHAGTVDCHCLNLKLSDGQVVPLLETTDAELVAAVAEIMQQHARVPLEEQPATGEDNLRSKLADRRKQRRF